MNKELKLWRFIASRLNNGESVMLLVVVESSGSSPGRAGYKMAVGYDGELVGSIGGGVMEVRLVELAKSKSRKPKGKIESEIFEQVHQKNSPKASGMICSGKQTVILREISHVDLESVQQVIDSLEQNTRSVLQISPDTIRVVSLEAHKPEPDLTFKRISDSEFLYQERMGHKNDLYIIGGGHCALALSELMSRMGFCISIFDDRPDINTLNKNRFVNERVIIQSYDLIGEAISSGPNVYVVVMTIGYKSDEAVVRKLIDKDFKYLGVLGSKAKVKTLLNSLAKEGFSKYRLRQIHMPIGVQINSRTPEEIAVSIAAEIIAIKNS